MYGGLYYDMLVLFMLIGAILICVVLVAIICANKITIARLERQIYDLKNDYSDPSINLQTCAQTGNNTTLRKRTGSNHVQ